MEGGPEARHHEDLDLSQITRLKVLPEAVEAQDNARGLPLNP
jgi:hypothetical protein